MGSRSRNKVHYSINFSRLKHKEKNCAELIMLLGSLERLEMKRKIKLGNLLTEQIASGSKDFVEAKTWALARLCAVTDLC